MFTKIFKIAAYALACALLLTHATYGQTDSDTGDSQGKAVPIMLEKVITVPAEKRSETYFFYVPVKAKYYIQSAEGGYGFKFRLYNKENKKIVEKRSTFEKELNPGSYWLQVTNGGRKFSFVITLHTSYNLGTPQSHEKWTLKGRQAEFAKAVTAPLSQNIEIDVAQEKREFFYRFQITEPARYLIKFESREEEEIEVKPTLYNENFRSLSEWTTDDYMFGLIKGTYYLKLGSPLMKIGKYDLVIAKEGEFGWDYKEPSWFRKLENKSPELYLVVLALLGVLIPVILFFAFRPYVRYLKNKHDIRFFGIPFFIMLIVLSGIIFLENYKNMTPGPLQYTILIVADILTTIWICISHYRKSNSVFLTVVNVILSHVAYVVAFVFLLFAFVLAIVVILVAIAGLILWGATALVGSVGFGSGKKSCPRCGRETCTCGYMSY